MIEKVLTWRKGPAKGGGGNAGMKNGAPLWADGETLLVMTEYNEKLIPELVVVWTADDDYSCLTTSDGRVIDTDDVFCWATLDEHNLPKEEEI